jgi:putative membrane protein
MTGSVFTDEDHQRITAAIRAVEAETSGEMVCVAARQCEPYQIIAVMWSLMAGLLAGVIAAPFWAGMPALFLVAGQGVVAGLMLLALQFLPLRMALVPRAVRQRRAHRLARTQFLEQGLHRTDGRTGILVFAAMAEHYVEIIADEGINDRIDPAVWNAIIGDFTGLMRKGETVSAFEGAIASCGGLLKTHAPRPLRNPNELPDHLVEI